MQYNLPSIILCPQLINSWALVTITGSVNSHSFSRCLLISQDYSMPLHNMLRFLTLTMNFMKRGHAQDGGESISLYVRVFQIIRINQHSNFQMWKSQPHGVTLTTVHFAVHWWFKIPNIYICHIDSRSLN